MRWSRPVSQEMRDMERRVALVELLKLPDPPDIKRGYRYTQSRPAHRDPDVIKRDLGTAYVQHTRQTYGTDISAVVSVRRRRLADNVFPMRRTAK